MTSKSITKVQNQMTTIKANQMLRKPRCARNADSQHETKDAKTALLIGKVLKNNDVVRVSKVLIEGKTWS